MFLRTWLKSPTTMGSYLTCISSRCKSITASFNRRHACCIKSYHTLLSQSMKILQTQNPTSPQCPFPSPHAFLSPFVLEGGDTQNSLLGYICMHVIMHNACSRMHNCISRQPLDRCYAASSLIGRHARL